MFLCEKNFFLNYAKFNYFLKGIIDNLNKNTIEMIYENF